MLETTRADDDELKMAGARDTVSSAIPRDASASIQREGADTSPRWARGYENGTTVADTVDGYATRSQLGRKGTWTWVRL